jgi:hypothetical protein
VDFSTGRPISDRTVTIDRTSTTTASDGTFSLPAPTDYDVTIVDPDGSTMSVYRGLTRRDPHLLHKPSASSVAARNVALVMGEVSGGKNYPLTGTDAVDIFFFSPQAEAYVLLAGTLPQLDRGPTYGPLSPAWNGPSTLTGHLAALGTFSNRNNVGSSWWFADQPITVPATGTIVANVALTPVAKIGIVHGSIAVPNGYYVTGTSFRYRFPGAYSTMALPYSSDRATTFDATLPNLLAGGLDLCVTAAGAPGTITTERCGIPLDAPSPSVTLDAPPTVLSPTNGELVTVATRFSWTPYANGIHVLLLDPLNPTPKSPSIYLYTTSTSTTWPEGTTEMMAAAVPVNAAYECRVAGYGPYNSMDDAVGPTGITDTAPSEKRRNYSVNIIVNAQP